MIELVLIDHNGFKAYLGLFLFNLIIASMKEELLPNRNSTEKLIDSKVENVTFASILSFMLHVTDFTS